MGENESFKLYGIIETTYAHMQLHFYNSDNPTQPHVPF